jgi:hypothetical protein
MKSAVTEKIRDKFALMVSIPHKPPIWPPLKKAVRMLSRPI